MNDCTVLGPLVCNGKQESQFGYGVGVGGASTATFTALLNKVAVLRFRMCWRG